MTTPPRARARRHGVFAAVLLVAVALVSTACSSKKDTAATANGGTSASSGGGKGGLIGASLYTQQVARFVFEEKRMREVATHNGDQFISNFANNSLQTQISQIQSMMQRGIKVLILNQIDAKAFAPIVAQAQRQGIKVIAYDTEVEGAKP